jgi:2-amino-4-hydroxy-6-hydroxymethyldihydropteridine diphosphokinase
MADEAGGAAYDTSPSVYLGLGGNLGDRAARLREGLWRLAPDVGIEAVSSLYETDPVGVVDQPAFLNAVCRGRTALEPQALLDRVKEIERAAGRRAGPRWGPRPLDIDILLYGDRVISSPNLQIPHPRLAERAFVLCPLADLAPAQVVPGLRRTVQELLATVDRRGVRKVAEPGWERSEAGGA